MYVLSIAVLFVTPRVDQRSEQFQPKPAATRG
jgi:hypothetical protein